MDIPRLTYYLDHPDEAATWLRSWNLADVVRGHANLVNMATSGLTLDLLALLCDQLTQHLPALSDPDMALNNLERFVAAARNPLSFGGLVERDPEALPPLLQIFSTSQHLSDLLITDNECYDLLRITEGQPVGRDELVDELATEVAAVRGDEAAVMKALRRFKRRETLRISYGDIVRGQRLDVVTRQISHVADAVIEAAVAAAWSKLTARRAAPQLMKAAPARFVVLALGKLGGVELNYSSDVDLVFLYDAGRNLDGAAQQAAQEFFATLAREVLKLLTEVTDLGAAYRVDLRLRPDGRSGPMAMSFDAAQHYYDNSGRTWERQAYVKARAVAGDLALGREFLKQLEPWVYRRYLSRADISGIKALKRRIEMGAYREGADALNVKTGHGGIRDVEFVIQFLQLLNGGDLVALRTGNTLEAIVQLELCGCLTHQERTLLEENYSFLRKIEHRLQIMFDLQTHMLPTDLVELEKLAKRLGFADMPELSARDAFSAAHKHATEVNRAILDHLLHDAFSDETQTEPESDLVLDPEPAPERIAAVLGKYRFLDVPQAYKNLMDLASEKIRFLSTRRCRHFLAAIAPRLLKAISATPSPDFTLVNLAKVSDSLGGKGVLWELFSFNPPTLRLYVELCSSSQYLSAILTSNPGMLDELLDGLLLDKLPTLEQLRAVLADLSRGAQDLDPILHSFKNTQQLRVGVRDILGKEPIEAVTGALSDVAEACLDEIVATEYGRLVAKWGEPTIFPTGESDADPPSPAVRGPGRVCPLMVVALGKFGGREINYYSDLDVIFLYEAEGMTVQSRRSKRDEVTTNQHFFSELGQRIIKVATNLGPFGRLYQIDPRLRPTGRSGPLATSLAEFAKYFASGQGQLWERQALCKARLVVCPPAARELALNTLHDAAFAPGWHASDLETVHSMRSRIERSAPSGNLKRGPGGLADIEFLVQSLQLKHGHDDRSLRVAGTFEAMAALHAAGHMSRDDYEFFNDSYRFLRTLQARLRLMSPITRDTLPEDPHDLARLAGLLGYGSAATLLSDCQHITAENRRRFDRLFEGVAA